MVNDSVRPTGRSSGRSRLSLAPCWPRHHRVFFFQSYPQYKGCEPLKSYPHGDDFFFLLPSPFLSARLGDVASRSMTRCRLFIPDPAPPWSLPSPNSTPASRPSLPPDRELTTPSLPLSPLHSSTTSATITHDTTASCGRRRASCN